MSLFTSWGPVIRSSTATTTATIDFTDLGDYRELKLEIFGLQHNSGTPDFYIQVDSDNGASFVATNYIHAGDTGTAAWIIATAVPTTTSVAACVIIDNWNQAAISWARIRGGREGSATGARTAHGYNTGATAWNALRVTNSTATNFTANTLIRLYGKV